MIRNKIEQDYFDWMVNLVCYERLSEKRSFRRMLQYLHDTEFIYYTQSDADRAADGIDLRYRFSYGYFSAPNAERELTGPCSVLEMMIALAIRCEETIMSDPRYGDRTTQWFWRMIVNLGLGGMLDDRFDAQEMETIVDIFLRREYEPNGKGGLFVLRNCEHDLREVDIWTQMNWYIETMRY